MLEQRGDTDIVERLSVPIPNMDDVRERKRSDYRTILIDRKMAVYREPLVDIHTYKIAGQNYYSRPNATVSEPIPGVPIVPELRQSVAETLRTLNHLMRNIAVTAFFGAEVELYVQDGLRTTLTQKRLFETEVPQLLLRNDPLLTEEQVNERKRDIISAASTDPDRPSPHSTGGAVDVILRYRRESPLFVPDSNVWIGHTDGDTARSIDPDYYETHPIKTPRDELALKNRRAFYSIMTGKAFDIDTKLAVNPTEIWHWSRGDQLWARTTGASSAYYGAIES